MTYHSMGGEVTARARGFGARGLVRSGPPLPITWTCVLGAHMRCHPRGGDTGPASASSGPGSVLGDIKRKDLLSRMVNVLNAVLYPYMITMCKQIVYQ